MRVLHFKYFSVMLVALASVGCDKHEPVKPRRFPGQQSEATVATHQQVGKDLPAESRRPSILAIGARDS